MDGHALLLLESYSARLARQGLAPGTRAKYLAAVEHFLSWLDRADPTAATRQELDQYLDAWHVESSPSPNTVRLRLSALKSFYSYLDDRELLRGRNPVERIKSPRVRRKPNDRLGPDEDRAMLEACATEQETALIWLLRWHTLRRTYGSDLLNRGVRMEAVSKLLGHADVRVTAACYAELLDETVRDEVRRAMAS